MLFDNELIAIIGLRGLTLLRSFHYFFNIPRFKLFFIDIHIIFNFTFEVISKFPPRTETLEKY